jgi:hypothetical protein
MAISYVDAVVGSSSPVADTTITYPGTMAVGDLIILAVGHGDNDNVDVDMTVATRIQVGANWNLIPESDIHVDGATSDTDLGVYYKEWGGGDTSVVVNGANAGGADASLAVVFMVFRGVKSIADGGPFDVTPVPASSTTGTVVNPGAINITGTGLGIWVVIAGAIAHTATTPTMTFPTGYTTNAAFRSHNDTIDITTGVGYKSSPADPEDPGNMTLSATTGATGFAALTMALAEAPPPPTLEFPLFVGPDMAIYSGPG